MPLVGKVPPWRQPPKPDDPDAPRPFAWLRDDDPLAPRTGSRRGRPAGRPIATTRAARATRRRASPGCGPDGDGLRGGSRTGCVAAAAHRWPRGSIPRAASSSRRRARTDKLGRPTRWDPPAPTRDRAGAISVARVEPEPPPQARGGSTVGMCDWERWLEFCARIDGFPRHLVDPLGRDARDRGAAHRHRPDRAGDDGRPGRRPVRQARRRDAQAHQARPARARDARRDGRDAPAHRARLRGLPRPRPAARGRPRGLRDAPGGRHGRRLPGREPGPDADAPEVAAAEPRRPRGRGRDHPAGPDPGQRRPPVPAPQAGPRAGDLPPPEPRAGPQGLDGRDPLPGAGHADRDRGRRLHARPNRTGSGGRWARGARAARWRSSTAQFVDGCAAPAGDDRGDRRGAVPPGRRVRRASGSPSRTRRRSPGRPTNRPS